MKIAFHLPANHVSGGLYVAYQHAHHLASRGHDVTVVFLSGHMGTEITHFANFSLPVRLLREVVDSGTRFDLVLSGWWECFYSMFRIEADHYLHFIQGDDRESIAHHIGTRDAEPLPYIERAFSDPRVGYLVVAKWLKERLEASDDLCVEYAPNGIDTSLFHPAVEPLEPRGGRVRVLIEGPGGAAFKRVGMAFRVARRLPDIEIWYVSGDGVVDPEWECDRTFRRMRQQDMPAIHASCDILLKLSVVEGFFGPPLEMMACGGTAVVAKVHGHEEYVVHERNALVVDLDDEEGAYRALRRLVEDRELRKRLSREGERTAKALDWSVRCPLFEEAVHRLLVRTPRLPRADRTQFTVVDALRYGVEGGRRESADLRRELSDLRREVAEVRNTLQNWKVFRYWLALRRRAGRARAAVHRCAQWCKTLYRRPAAPQPAVATPEPSGAPAAEADVARPATLRKPAALRPTMPFGSPVVFVGQPEYFRSAYYDLTCDGEHYEFPITSRDCSALRRLPYFVRDRGARGCVIFRPEWFAQYPEAFQELKALGVAVVGYSTEPVPRSGDRNPHPDQVSRMGSLRDALRVDYDLIVHFDPSSLDPLRAAGFRRLMGHPLPVSRKLFFPQDHEPEFDVCFLGRSTPHREEMIAPLKAAYATVHVAHGLRDEHARELMNRSRLVLNIHNHNYLNFENRVVQALFCGRPVLSEPLSGNLLQPGSDYLVFRTSDELRRMVEQALRGGTTLAPKADLSYFAAETLMERLAGSLGGDVPVARAA